MGKPGKLTSALLLTGALATGAQAENNEIVLASLGNKGPEVSTLEEGSVGREQMEITVEAERARLIAQIEMGEKACKIVKKTEGKKPWRKCKREKISPYRLALTELEVAELAQSVEAKRAKKAELAQSVNHKKAIDTEKAQVEEVLDSNITELAQSVDKKQAMKDEQSHVEEIIDKESAEKDLNIAALEALKKVKAKMRSE